ncbi:Hypp5742 [Branchiostoma lanceolatum]|uniref:Hypp5742 protein n=1 Tax=Branchiostoma lanceolatum TaxID=7740 RepID=A0A8J9YNT6_BRALA|nr:Hypp5742 [Branchiostoma lanceolatum]
MTGSKYCRACSLPVKGHKGPHGVGKCREGRPRSEDSYDQLRTDERVRRSLGDLHRRSRTKEFAKGLWSDLSEAEADTDKTIRDLRADDKLMKSVDKSIADLLGLLTERDQTRADRSRHRDQKSTTPSGASSARSPSRSPPRYKLPTTPPSVRPKSKMIFRDESRRRARSSRHRHSSTSSARSPSRSPPRHKSSTRQTSVRPKSNKSTIRDGSLRRARSSRLRFRDGSASSARSPSRSPTRYKSPTKQTRSRRKSNKTTFRDESSRRARSFFRDNRGSGRHYRADFGPRRRRDSSTSPSPSASRSPLRRHRRHRSRADSNSRKQGFLKNVVAEHHLSTTASNKLTTLSDIMYDANYYEWPVVHEMYASIMYALEKGAFSWSDLDEVEGVRDRHYRTAGAHQPRGASAKPPHGSQGSTATGRSGARPRREQQSLTEQSQPGTRPKYCGLFQEKSCPHQSHHWDQYWGTQVKHVCNMCLLKRQTEAGHPRADCPYNDPTFRANPGPPGFTSQPGAGLEQAPKKAVPPTTSLTWLGIEFDTVAMIRRDPSFRLDEVSELVTQWLSKRKASKRELQSLIGKLVFVSACVPPGRLFVSRMLDTLRSLRRNTHRFRLSRDFRLDLAWWDRFLHVFNGVSLIAPTLDTSPDEVVSTDACSTGCGAYSDGLYFHTRFPESLAQRHRDRIHVLEMLTIVVAARLWGSAWSHLRILVRCDNEACVHVLNSGRSRDKDLLTCARELWMLAATHTFELKASHISGCDNRIADHLSRWHLSPSHAEQFPSDDLHRLRGEVRRTKLAAFAQGTWNNLRSTLRAYLLFCAFYMLTPFPASVDTLEVFAEFLARSFRSPASVVNYLSGLKTLHNLIGLSTVAFDSTHMTLLKRGLHKQLRHTPKQALPFTPAILLLLLEQLTPPPPTGPGQTRTCSPPVGTDALSDHFRSRFSAEQSHLRPVRSPLNFSHHHPPHHLFS